MQTKGLRIRKTIQLETPWAPVLHSQGQPARGRLTGAPVRVNHRTIIHNAIHHAMAAPPLMLFIRHSSQCRLALLRSLMTLYSVDMGAL